MILQRRDCHWSGINLSIITIYVYIYIYIYFLFIFLFFIFLQILHGEQYMEIFQPIPTSGELVSTGRIADVLDKGFGAVVLINGMISFDSFLVTKNRKDSLTYIGVVHCVTAFIIGNRTCWPRSNSGRGCISLHANALGKGMNTSVFFQLLVNSRVCIYLTLSIKCRLWHKVNFLNGIQLVWNEFSLCPTKAKKSVCPTLYQ